jgi:hypothetical protein
VTDFYDGAKHPDKPEPTDQHMTEPGDDPNEPVYDKAMEQRPWLYQWDTPKDGAR